MLRPPVTRVYEGRAVTGDLILPEEYAVFLRGAMAEEEGDLGAALSSYQAVADSQPDDPELWTRVGAVRCQNDPRDKKADAAIERAISIDPEYAPAWSARAKCALLRGEDRVRVERSAWQAVDYDPQAIEPQILLASALAMQPRKDEAVRERLMALTLKHRVSAAAWRALGAWAKSHRDTILLTRAYGEMARLAPSAHGEVAAIVMDLAGNGELTAARTLAGSLIDGRRTLGARAEMAVPGGRLVSRLAVDDAIVSGDRDRTRRRAVSGHLPLDVVAGRALLLGRPDMARDFAEPLVKAEPRAIGARLVLAILAYDADDKSGLSRAFAASGATRGDLPVAAEAMLPFLRLVSRAMGPEIARRVATALPCEQTLAGDALVVPLAVALVHSGALSEDALSPDGRLELAVRRGESVTGSLEALDARHRLLALASTHPTSKEARALLHRVGAIWPRDPLVAVAMGRMAVAGAVQVDGATVAQLAEVAPADLLVATTALALAQKQGDAVAAKSIRARLSGLATTSHQAR